MGKGSKTQPRKHGEVTSETLVMFLILNLGYQYTAVHFYYSLKHLMNIHFTINSSIIVKYYDSLRLRSH